MGIVPLWVNRAREAAVVPGPAKVQRSGLEFGAPKDGQGFGVLQSMQGERRESLADQLQLYLTCPWVSACIDTIARTCTAGGIEMVPTKSTDDSDTEPARPAQLDRLEALMQYVNPAEDAIQLFRRIIIELLIFGDSYTEVGWMLGEPVALWALDPISMIVDCDEHGDVRGYKQITDDNREVDFAPEQVIHVSMDTPRGGVYGISPTQKAILPATAWLWNEACIKESSRRGHPSRVHVDFPTGTAVKEVDRWVSRIATRVLGSRNIGQPYTTIGGATINNISPSTIVDMLDVGRQLRDEIISTYGMQPHAVGVIETGNLGGGTGEAQTKSLRINTVIPIEGIIMEKFNFHITQTGFGITEWKMRFTDVDLRDSKTVEDIRMQRLVTGAYTINRYRSDIGEPPIDGGDVAIFEAKRQGPIAWNDMERFTDATIESLEAAADSAEAAAKVAGQPPPDPTQPTGTGTPNQAGATKAASDKQASLQVDQQQGTPQGAPKEAEQTMRALETAYRAAYRARRKRALAEAARASADDDDDDA